MRRRGPLAVGLLLLLPQPAAAAEKQIRPFVAVTFKGSTTFLLGDAVGKRHGVFGINAALVGDNIFGIEGDVGWVPGFFEPDAERLVLSSGVTTLTGNVIVTLPKRLTEYSLRPYFVAGLGMMHVTVVDSLSVFDVSKALAAYDIGGGAVGFLTNRVGLAWDVRRFGTLKGSTEPGGTTGGPGRVAFWRASMALVLRY